MSKIWNRYEVTCAHCGWRGIKNNKQLTCSLKCRAALQKQRTFEKRQNTSCVACGAMPALRTMMGQACCSSRCSQRLRMVKIGTWSKKLRKVPDKTPFQCQYCGKSVIRKYHRQIACSKRCSRNLRWLRQSMVRKKERLALEEKYGKCALCHTAISKIIPMNVFGSARSDGYLRLHRDHIRPRSKNGTDDNGNLRYICWVCNIRRLNLVGIDAAIAKSSAIFWEEINKGPVWT